MYLLHVVVVWQLCLILGQLIALVSTQNFDGAEEDNDFQILYPAGQHLLVGGRNVMYNLTLDSLEEKGRVTWTADDASMLTCNLQYDDGGCQNYIKLIQKEASHPVLVCGTYAHKPRCKHFKWDEHTNTYANVEATDEDENGLGLVPPDPKDNNTAIIVNGRLYAGTKVAGPDIPDGTSIIYNKPLVTDRAWLKDPSFVEAMSYGDHVYFFLRERAAETKDDKEVYSRVARVCKDDKGGKSDLAGTFTSFFKARLLCSLSGRGKEGYYEEIQSITSLGHGHVLALPSTRTNETADIVYAVFTRKGKPGSAICAYRMKDIQAAFQGAFLQKVGSKWVPSADVPDTHPGKACPKDSTALPKETQDFIKTHQLMQQAVPAFGGGPTLVDANKHYRLNSIAVHWQQKAADNLLYDIVYVGTDHGHVLKAVHRPNPGQPGVIEDLEVFADSAPVVSIKLIRMDPGPVGQGSDKEEHHTLVVMSRNQVVVLALHRCEARVTCRVCMDDPSCVWHVNACDRYKVGLNASVCPDEPETGLQGERCFENCISPCENNDTKTCPRCVHGFYGNICKQICHANCSDGSGCKRDTGNCNDCPGGLYGPRCNLNCPDRCNDTCHVDSGLCTDPRGKVYADEMKRGKRTEQGTRQGQAAVIGVAVFLTAGVAFIVYARRRQIFWHESDQVPIITHADDA